jgi:hypothetical protein
MVKVEMAQPPRLDLEMLDTAVTALAKVKCDVDRLIAYQHLAFPDICLVICGDLINVCSLIAKARR